MPASVSKYGLGVIDRLQGEGLSLRPVDIIRINSIGLRIENPRGELGVLSAPVAVQVAGVWFHEPTVQSLTWYDCCACEWWRNTDGLMRALGYALCFARTPGAFAGEMLEERAARRVVGAWWRFFPGTKAELHAVVARLLGASTGQDDTRKTDASDGCDFEWLLSDLELATGQTRERWQTETPAYCVEMLRRWWRKQVAESGSSAEELNRSAYMEANAEMLKLCEEIRRRE